MEKDARTVLLQALRWCVVVLLLVFAWQNIVSTVSAQDEAATKEPVETPPKAPPGPVDDFDRGVPRTAVEGYITAVRKSDYERAAEYLDLRNLPQDLLADGGPELAKKLGVVLSRVLWIETGRLSDDPAGFADDGQPSYRDYIDSVEIDDGRVDILLQRVPRGDGVSIWKFSNATVRQIPVLYDQYGYGPLGEWLLQNFPEGRFLGLHIWQWAFMIVLVAGAWIAAIVITRLLGLAPRLRGRPLGKHGVRFLHGPLRLLVGLLLVREWIDVMNPPVTFRAAMRGKIFLVLVVAWVLVHVVDILRGYWSQKLRQAGREQAIVLLQPLSTAAKVTVILGAAVLWLDNIGFEVTTLLTGLGLGGVALALAAQKSVEDIFGAVTLFSAAPVRVGDFCRFGDRIGTVEEIGLRITRIRTLDRTVVSVPNGRFAAMEIENFATREKFRYAPRLRLRYGTTPDQLRYVIVEMQRLFHGHPKVIPPPAKARFTNFGEYSLEFDVFTYIDASSFDEFQEVAEDLNLRVMEIVKKAGTDFAVPEKTVTVSKARQADDVAALAAVEEVARWREAGELPLPVLSQKEIDEISNTLKYPPEGAKQ